MDERYADLASRSLAAREALQTARAQMLSLQATAADLDTARRAESAEERAMLKETVTQLAKVREGLEVRG